MRQLKYISLALALLLGGCIDDNFENNPITYGQGYMPVQLSTDKAAYAPGQTVNFSLNKMIGESVTVRYKHLNKVIHEHPLNSTSWQWAPPKGDFQGYLIDLYSKTGSSETILGSIAVDVSSSPERFPRNGFLSAYGAMSDKEINSIVDNLNRHHINYMQYQDWHYKHHLPLAGSPAAPMTVWKDIINRNCYKATVQGYIEAGHRRGIKSLFYNLAYGALSDAASDGVKPEWYIFKDANHKTTDFHPLGAPFKSNIYVVNSGNTEWQDYIAAKNDDLYKVFDFDGYQIDQLGNRGTRYDYDGNRVYLDQTFKEFIEAMKRKHPNKRLVMNAVNQYGQQNYIAPTDVDFLYTEVWSKNDNNGYDIIANIIKDNDKWSDGKKTVLAAYINYDYAKKGNGYFNTPGVLMASAVIHAWGGAHLQLGEHMLSTEYFPNSSLSMDGELRIAMIKYYDFITAYENLLRDGGSITTADVASTDNKMVINQWPPVRGKVATIAKKIEGSTVIQLLNYTNATHLDWCDKNATQPEQKSITGGAIEIKNITGSVKNVWAATPDHNDGVSATVPFTQTGTTIKLTLPMLKYWTILVIEQ